MIISPPILGSQISWLRRTNISNLIKQEHTQMLLFASTGIWLYAGNRIVGSHDDAYPHFQCKCIGNVCIQTMVHNSALVSYSLSIGLGYDYTL